MNLRKYKPRYQNITKKTLKRNSDQIYINLKISLISIRNSLKYKLNITPNVLIII